MMLELKLKLKLVQRFLLFCHYNFQIQHWKQKRVLSYGTCQGLGTTGILLKS